MKIYRFDSLPSTNEYAKQLQTEEDAAVIADEQPAGKGSKGRSFTSRKGGVYLSLLRIRPCKAKDGFRLMENAALSVVYTLAAFGVNATIKWPNDVFAEGKKICGILIENVFEGDEIARSVTGIGINVNNELPPELDDIATSVKKLTGKECDPQAVAATLLYNLGRTYAPQEYIDRSGILGKEIRVLRGEETFLGVCEGFTDDGRLILSGNRIFSAGEVTIC